MVDIDAGQAMQLRRLTRAMHQIARGPAAAWPKAVNLGYHEVLLDVGGGSGAHSIAALQCWPNLRSILFDFEPACEVAKGYIQDDGMAGRIEVAVGDMFHEPYPPADVHLYSWVLYAFPNRTCRVLIDKSFNSLPNGGRIIIHEMLYANLEDARSGRDLNALLRGEGRTFGRALERMLAAAGFEEIETIPTFEQWSIITGRKPRTLNAERGEASIRSE